MSENDDHLQEDERGESLECLNGPAHVCTYVPAPPDGGFETTVTLDKALQKRVSRSSKILGVICVVYGLALILVMAVIRSVMFLLDMEADLLQFFLIVLFGLTLALVGLMLLVGYSRNLKLAEKRMRTAVYRFYRGFFTVTTVRAGENMGTIKIYYSDLVQTRETKEFILLYVNAAAVYPVDKKSLTGEETALIRTLLGK